MHTSHRLACPLMHPGSPTCILSRNALNLGLLCSACAQGCEDGGLVSAAAGVVVGHHTCSVSDCHSHPPDTHNAAATAECPASHATGRLDSLPAPLPPLPSSSPLPPAAGTAPAPLGSAAPACAAQPLHVGSAVQPSHSSGSMPRCR